MIEHAVAPINWEDRWRAQVKARAAQVERLRVQGGEAYWASRGRRFQAMAGVAATDDPVLSFLDRWLSPETTVLDVGAGFGRYALAIAPLVSQVIAVEPSSAMADLLRQGARDRRIENIRVIEARWDECDILDADLVFCAHVLYPIEEVGPFVRRLDAAARDVCVLALRTQPPEILLHNLWVSLHGEPPRSDPAFLEAYNLLWSLGIEANATLVPAAPLRFANRESALAWARDMLWLGDDEVTTTRLWPMLAPLLEPQADGAFMARAAGRYTAMTWWESRRLP
jgi:SAM-dependent methyltransferase